MSFVGDGGPGCGWKDGQDKALVSGLEGATGLRKTPVYLSGFI